MSNAQNHDTGTGNPSRLAAAIVLMLVLGTGYLVSPQVSGASSPPSPAEDQDFVDSMQFEPECGSHGLVLFECE